MVDPGKISSIGRALRDDLGLTQHPPFTGWKKEPREGSSLLQVTELVSAAAPSSPLGEATLLPPPDFLKALPVTEETGPEVKHESSLTQGLSFC